MNKTESYLRQRYEATRWPYYGLNETNFIVGESYTNDIKELRAKGMVQPVPGINGWLIQIIEWETKWKQLQD